MTWSNTKRLGLLVRNKVVVIATLSCSDTQMSSTLVHTQQEPASSSTRTVNDMQSTITLNASTPSLLSRMHDLNPFRLDYNSKSDKFRDRNTTSIGIMHSGE